MRCLAPDGSELRAIVLGDRSGWYQLGGEVEPGVLLVSGYYFHETLLTIDLTTGATRDLAVEAVFAGAETGALPGSTASRLVSCDGELCLVEGGSLRRLRDEVAEVYP